MSVGECVEESGMTNCGGCLDTGPECEAFNDMLTVACWAGSRHQDTWGNSTASSYEESTNVQGRERSLYNVAVYNRSTARCVYTQMMKYATIKWQKDIHLHSSQLHVYITSHQVYILDDAEHSSPVLIRIRNMFQAMERGRAETTHHEHDKASTINCRCHSLLDCAAGPSHQVGVTGHHALGNDDGNT